MSATRRRGSSISLMAGCVLAIGAQGALAKVSADEARRLGQDLTCFGAEKAGNKDGSIPAYTGKQRGAPPNVKYGGPGHFWPDPYADEKPLFVITAQNVAQYADRMTDGQKALFKKYPDTFQMSVYPSHRDWGFPQWACDLSKKNAVEAEVVDGGAGVRATSGVSPFPIPKTGYELQWNVVLPLAPAREVGTFDSAVVYPNGTIAWAREFHKVVVSKADTRKHVSTEVGANSYSFSEKLIPERDKGTLTYARVPFNYKKDFLDVWQYSPGTRRVRQLPNFGFDQPNGPGGFLTVDDELIFNGSNERYDWRIVGKQEIYIPYNTYRLHSPTLRYGEMLKTKGHINPDFIRYELHRVWVLEATLKAGYRHLYGKRRIYIDEDSWVAVLGDNYDGRHQLWRTAMCNTLYLYEAQSISPLTCVYHDLNSSAYAALRLINEQKAPMTVDDGSLKESQFTPDMLRAAGR
ncbi:DUF1329 domain-containing protein [Pandoraea sp. NPDC087047]|uniref:DUF1329 domain-containing protein n=1 Tax=Pandoraea sp. NPDC087047 TaxID=3364390 RepID=UPI0038182EF0